MRDVKTKLEAGGLVADLGCGVAFSSIALAKGFPLVHVDAIDVDRASCEQATINVANDGVGSQVDVHLAFGHDLPEMVNARKGQYDMVMIFEALHDMHNPVQVLLTAKSLLNVEAPHACVFVGDENVENTLGEMLPASNGTRAAGFLENGKNFRGRMNYSFSVLHCLPQSMVFPGSASIGTCIHPFLVERFASEAGFAKCEAVHENGFFKFYRLFP
jgi:SAM-dependent methyltransferase